jgi:hypothetical protein
MIDEKEPWELYQDANWQTVYTSPNDAFGRTVNIQTAKWECDLCKHVTDVLEIDTSDGEYLSFTCCAPCFQNLINQGKK